MFKQPTWIPRENLIIRIYIITTFTLTASIWHLVSCILTKSIVRNAKERHANPQLFIEILINVYMNGTLY